MLHTFVSLAIHLYVLCYEHILRHSLFETIYEVKPLLKNGL
jgi:hypothetical protein